MSTYELLQQERQRLASQIPHAVDALAIATDDETRKELDARITAMRSRLTGIEEQLATSKPPEPLADFIRKHGGSPLPIDRKGKLAKPVNGRTTLWLLPSGATFLTDQYTDTRNGPPTDPERNWKQRRDYAAARVEIAENDFDAMKASIMGTSDRLFTWPESEYGPAPNTNPEAALQHLKSIVEERREILAELDDEPIAVEMREREEREQELLLERQADARRREYEQRERLAAIEI